MQIKKMTEKDVDFVFEISKEVFNKNSWSRALFINDLNDSNKDCYVCLQDEKVVGFLNVLYTVDEMTILNIAVSKDYQRRGYGTALLKKCFENARNKKVFQVFLEVEEKNLAAIDLYKKFNFEILKMRKSYYPDGTNALEMILKL